MERSASARLALLSAQARAGGRGAEGCSERCDAAQAGSHGSAVQQGRGGPRASQGRSDAASWLAPLLSLLSPTALPTPARVSTAPPPRLPCATQPRPAPAPAPPTSIQVGGGLVQRQDAAVEAEGLGQGQPDDEAGQHLQRTGSVGGGRGDGTEKVGSAQQAGRHTGTRPPPPSRHPAPRALHARAHTQTHNAHARTRARTHTHTDMHGHMQHTNTGTHPPTHTHTRPHLLPRRAAAAHVELRAAGVHHNPVVVGAPRCALLVRLDLRGGCGGRGGLEEGAKSQGVGGWDMGCGVVDWGARGGGAAGRSKQPRQMKRAAGIAHLQTPFVSMSRAAVMTTSTSTDNAGKTAGYSLALPWM